MTVLLFTGTMRNAEDLGVNIKSSKAMKSYSQSNLKVVTTDLACSRSQGLALGQSIEKWTKKYYT